MTSPFKQFGTSADAELAGVWLNFGSFQVLVARAGGKNVRFEKLREQYFEPYRRAAELGALDEATATPVLAEVYADAIVLGWRTKLSDGGFVNTIEGPEGEPWEYTRANVIKFLVMLPDLFLVIRQNALNWQNFKAALSDDSVKN